MHYAALGVGGAEILAECRRGSSGHGVSRPDHPLGFLNMVWGSAKAAPLFLFLKFGYTILNYEILLCVIPVQTGIHVWIPALQS